MASFTSAQNKIKNPMSCPESPSFLVPRPCRLREAKRAMGTRMAMLINDSGGKCNGAVLSTGKFSNGTHSPRTIVFVEKLYCSRFFHTNGKRPGTPFSYFGIDQPRR